jgi:hypothetical protein
MTHLLILALVFIPLVFQPHLPIASTLVFGRVGTHGRFVSLGFASSPAVRMVDGIHGYTSDSRPDAEPSLPPSLSILDMLVCFVAHDANCGTNTAPQLADLTTCELTDGMLSLVVQNLCKSSSCATQLCSSMTSHSQGKYDGIERHHSEGQTVSLDDGFDGHDTRVDVSTHALHQILRNACSVTLDLVTGAETLGSEDVGLLSGFVVLDEGNVARTAGVVFNAKDSLGTRVVAMVID